MRRWIGLLGLSVVALATVDACAPEAERQLGRMMVDAGSMLADAGTSFEMNGGGSGSSGSTAGDQTAGSGGADGGDGIGSGGTGGLLADAGQALVDAGQALVDAGQALLDAGVDAGRDASAQDPVNVNGSRIEIRKTTQTGGDGTRYEVPFMTFHDTQLDTDCNLMAMSDGTKRCVPVADAYLSGSLYGDAACTMRVLLVASSCTNPGFVLESVTATPASCTVPYHTRAYRVGTEVGGTVYSDGSSGCQAATWVDGYNYFRVGAEILPTDLVEFTESVVAI